MTVRFAAEDEGKADNVSLRLILPALGERRAVLADPPDWP